MAEEAAKVEATEPPEGAPPEGGEAAAAPPPPPVEEEAPPPPAADEPEEKKCEECPDCPPVGAPAWMATFADMATLLMAFFVLILSFAEMNVPKFKQISGSLKNSFGVQRLIPTVEPPKAQSLIAQQFSPAVAQPTVIDTIRQDTTDDNQKEVELKTESKTEDPRPDPQTQAQAKAVEKALAEEVAKGLVEVRAEGQKVVVQMNPPQGREAGRGGGAGDQGQKSAGSGQKGEQSAGAADKGEKSAGAMGQKGESTGGVVNQETIELFAKIAEAQTQVTAQVEVRQAGPQTGARSGATGPDGKSTGSGGGGANEAEVANRFEQIKADLAKEIAAGQAEVMRDGLKIVIRLAEQGSFVSGRADLQPGFMPLLQKVGKTISSGNGQVKIEGHTDNVPVIMNERFKSNWDLSAARSSAVADYISSRAGVQMSRISVSGHANTRPVDTNNTAEGRSRNRRIEIIVDG
ncbi:MAG: flagellar motor protein [Betaproteobacteria bacterium]|nr:flagellar motor protein [Betaproteobacteria bacterium]